jgi:hypothetical protein
VQVIDLTGVEGLCFEQQADFVLQNREVSGSLCLLSRAVNYGRFTFRFSLFFSGNLAFCKPQV